MKAKIVQPDIECSPAHMPPGHEEQWEYRDTFRNGEMMQVPFWKPGAILDMPDVWVLVRQGVAEPADDACMQRAFRTPEEMKVAQHAYKRLAAGIDPNDFKLFDESVIVGYEGDGSFKPGPNFHLLDKIRGADPDDDEDNE